MSHLNMLKDSEPKKNAVADMNQILSEMNQSLKELKDAIAESDALPKR